jgi:hypothetical protein
MLRDRGTLLSAILRRVRRMFALAGLLATLLACSTHAQVVVVGGKPYGETLAPQSQSVSGASLSLRSPAIAQTAPLTSSASQPAAR